MNLAEKVKIKRSHAVIIGDTREKVHKNELAVSFSAISRFFVRLGFSLRPTFDNDDSGSATASNS